MTYIKRIGDNYLDANYVDGEVLQHVDLNSLESIVKTAINANYEDIQKIQNGTVTAGDAILLSGASLSKQIDETLQNSDTKVPSSKQVKTYVDLAIANIVDEVKEAVLAELE